MSSGFIQDIKEAKLFGHPIHSILVHFPSALFPVSVLFDWLAVLLNNVPLANAAFFTLGAGLIGGLCAAVFGAMDYYRLPSNHKGWKKAGLHAVLNILWLILFTILFGLRINQYPHIEFATTAELIISLIAIIGLIFSNFLGGDLIFRYKIGVQKDN